MGPKSKESKFEEKENNEKQLKQEDINPIKKNDDRALSDDDLDDVSGGGAYDINMSGVM